MSSSPIIIAIDGYSSTGKSTFAKLIAKTYGLLYLDSGALYRAVTLFAMENGFICGENFDISGLKPFLGDLNIHFDTSPSGVNQTFIGGRNVEEDIRTMGVSQNVSMVAADRSVRAFVDNILHEHGRRCNVVMDGRDIGSTVFPEAGLKIFMTAEPEIRAQRRAEELRAKGQDCSMEDVLKNLQERDYIDSHREISPLTKAEDAVVLDNSHMTMAQQMEWVSGIMQERFDIKPVKAYEG